VDEPFLLPKLGTAPGADGWREETTRYRVRPRPKPMFKSILDPKALFSGGDGTAEITTRTHDQKAIGEVALELLVRQQLGALDLTDRFTGVRAGAGVRAGTLERRIGEGRKEDVDFGLGPFPWPHATYPEVLLPFLMRGMPHGDGQRRAAYSWTSDRFVARVYYELREKETLDVPAGKIEAHHVWMYPDLNDWVALGSVLTRLAKPLLPRYSIWFEVAAPHRVVRFEGAYGPPGAPEVLLELST
jgi:hypothetical protein